MKVIYSDQDYQSLETNSLFLAGCTPRSNDVPSWRPEALKILKKINFNGTVLVPEWSNNEHKIDYTAQIEWEFKGLSQCGVIVFWVPSNAENMQALTTRVEFGMFLALRPNNVVYGRPNGAWKTEYFDWWAKRLLGKNGYAGNIYEDLETLLANAVHKSEYLLHHNSKLENVFKNKEFQ